MNVGVFGLGYVGLTASVCLAKEGHKVVGVDINEQKVKETNAGRSPIGEPGVNELLSQALNGGKLSCTTSAAEGLADCDLAIVCVGTPSGADGAHNISFIADVSRQIAAALEPERSRPLTVVYRSTVQPGTMDDFIRPIFDAVLGDRVSLIELVYNPEFLREASAVSDFFNPPKIVIGTHDGVPSARMTEFYAHLDAPKFHTRFREAEITKFVDNTFHALKVSYANEIGRICQELGIDVRKVHEIFVADTKLNISPAYLKPGGPFGGSCLPKDVRALQHLANDLGANSHVIDSIIRSNESHKLYLFQRVARELKKGDSVLMLGVAFKMESDDLRDSPGVDLAKRLLQSGYRLQIFDPFVNPKLLIGKNLGYAFSNLPKLGSLLVSRDVAESSTYDLVVDTSGMHRLMNLNSAKVVDLASMF
jgi:GDP-mannose 6-dehydrogenase